MFWKTIFREMGESGDISMSVNLDQPLFVYKYGDIVRYKNQCLTGTSLENRIFFLKKCPSWFFFYFNSYLDLYVFFYVKNICTLHFYSSINNCLNTVSPLCIQRNRTWSKICSKEQHYMSGKWNSRFQSRKDYTLSWHRREVWLGGQ